MLCLITSLTFSQQKVSDKIVTPQEVQYDGMPEFSYSINGKECCLDGRMKFNGKDVVLTLNRKKTSKFIRFFEGSGYQVVYKISSYGKCAGEGNQNITGSLTVSYKNLSKSFYFKGEDGFYSSKKCKAMGNG